MLRAVINDMDHGLFNGSLYNATFSNRAGLFVRTLLHFFISARAWFFCLLLLPPALLADNDLRVLASIRPLQIITNDIMRGVGQADVLIDATQSPHHFQLKPSQMRLASRTELLIWISNDFEAGLKRLQNTLPKRSHKLQLLPLLNAQNDNQSALDADGHIWLSPDIVIAMARLISHKLSALDRANATRYRQNTEHLIESLKQWKQRNVARLHQPEPSYIVDHRFLTHFERSLSLSQHDSLRNSHDGPASIRHLTHLQKILKQSPVKCLLVSKLPPGAQAQQISQQFKLKIQLIETLGKPEQTQTTIDFFDAIVAALEQCQ
jgi:zinc transport system substrate-binding protein